MDDSIQPIPSSPDIIINNNNNNNINPHQDDVTSETDDVTFPFNNLHITTNNNSNPQDLIPVSSKAHDNEEQDDDEEDDDDDDDDDDEDDDDFTFVCVGDNDNDLLATDVLEDGQIRKAFPLFDQSLLLSDNYDDGNGKRRLPIDVPVDKVFIESPRRSPSDNGETDGTLTALPKESEMNMKSNSTGFSKLWRFRNNEMNRSHSDGRDAFVFLESSNASVASTSDGKQNAVKVNGKGVGKGLKGKKITASAHEVYLKQKKKGGQTEEERRRSYLPYRPGLMGFFTNVNGGLSKNVHPF